MAASNWPTSRRLAVSRGEWLPIVASSSGSGASTTPSKATGVLAKTSEIVFGALAWTNPGSANYTENSPFTNLYNNVANSSARLSLGYTILVARVEAAIWQTGLDVALGALHAQGFEIGIETNGTIAPPPGIEWICVSPKADAAVVQTQGQELKLVFPQAGVDPARFAALGFERFYLQPMDGPNRQANTEAAIDYCLAHPQWRLSLQTHKYLGIP